MKTRQLVNVFILALILTLAAFAPFNKENIDWLVVKRLTVENGGMTATGAVNFDGAVDFDSTVDFSGATGIGGLTISTGGLTISDGDTVMADFAQISAQTAISVADGGIITPTGTYQPLASAGTITPTVATSGMVTGSVVTLINTSDTTINLADTGTAKLSAAWAAGQYDALVLWFDGTNWVEISRSDN